MQVTLIVGLAVSLLAMTVLASSEVRAQATQEITGIMWFDTNIDGIRQADEQRAGAIDYRIVEFEDDPNMVGVIRRVVIDSVSRIGGEYGASELTPGIYGLEITLPAGYKPGAVMQGDDPTIDNDFSTVVGQSALIQRNLDLRSGSTFANLDLGLVISDGPNLSGRVWSDTNANGLQDVGEDGLPNITYDLVSFPGGGQSGFVIFTGVTTADGTYGIDDVQPGNYAVVVRLPTGYSFGPQDVGDDDTIDNDFFGVEAGTQGGANAALAAGETLTNIDAGLVRDRVVGDANCDGRLNILDAFATAQYVVSLREGIESCPVADSRTQISLSAVRVSEGDAVNIQTAFRVAQCVVQIENRLCPATPGGDG